MMAKKLINQLNYALYHIDSKEKLAFFFNAAIFDGSQA